ncbi:MAG TPA: 4-hydroxy-tetrahydrodipicolinate reductase [Syntrophorhabdaceae bacterium]|nr:4-hydroxy-tetrahydrodipicolinate reductase [Syntrophorhabdaceae bacterium]
MIKLIITGAAGKVGEAVIKCALQDSECRIVGLAETTGHPLIGKPSPLMSGISEPPLIVSDLQKIISDGDVVIDFTEVKATLGHLDIISQYGKAHVIGTTGFNNEQINRIRCTRNAGIVFSPNMSIGMNVLFEIVNKVAGILESGYDIEIVEMHHRWKKDAPSGSALRLKDAVEDAHKDRTWKNVFGREGMTGERTTDEIGVMSLRAGDVVGEHTVYFVGLGERLELTHRAFSRDNFATGALKAAKWLIKQPWGVYSMKDVLGL